MDFGNRTRLDRYAQYKRQEKQLPFTVTDIGGTEELTKWKLDQAHKEQIWQEQKHQRIQNIKEIAYSDELLNKTFEKSEATKIHERYLKYIEGRTFTTKTMVHGNESLWYKIQAHIISFILNLKAN
jgi:hypothetical protein